MTLSSQLTLKSLFILSILFGLIFTSCYDVSGENTRKETVKIGSPSQSGQNSSWDEREYDAAKMKEATKKANFEFYNSLIYRDPEEWKGKIVGVIGKYPGTAGRSREFTRNKLEFYLFGTFNQHRVAVIVKLDHDLPVTVSFGNAVPKISPKDEILVIGRLLGTENILDEEGVQHATPILECLMIFQKDDISFQWPLWITTAFERLPDGTVTTDSLKYEFDPPKPH